MTWMAKLYETYEQIANNREINATLEPYFHNEFPFHVEIVLDKNGKYLKGRARSLVRCIKTRDKVVYRGTPTIITITPKSLTGRTSGSAPYPLNERIQYVAKNYKEYGGKKKGYFEDYFSQLKNWEEMSGSPKLTAIKRYVEKEDLIKDLASEGLLFLDKTGKLINKWGQFASSLKNEIDERWLEKFLTLKDVREKRDFIEDWLGCAKGKTKELMKIINGIPPKKLCYDSIRKTCVRFVDASDFKPDILRIQGFEDQGNTMIRWSVEIEGEPNSNTWGDEELISSWLKLQHSDENANLSKENFCQILGKKMPTVTKHPKAISPAENQAKLISSPTDKSYLTYLGKFQTASQAVGISFEASHKAHNALRWLIKRQGYTTNAQTVVAWAVSGKPIPKPLTDTVSLGFDLDKLEEVSAIESRQNEITTLDHSRNLGQDFALKLKHYMQGYHAKLKPTESIVIMAIDSATPGRLGITYYRDFIAKDYLKNLEDWHHKFAWYQRASNEQKEKYGKAWFMSAPSPWAILNAAYGDIIKSNETLKKNLYERLIPCIVENRPFPYDLVNLSIHQAGNRNNSEQWEWERNDGVACALFRGFFNLHTKHNLRRDYPMALDTEYRSRDYLYGRLLAVAECIEEMAMFIAGEPARSTQAGRLMQRFSDHPASTWLLIEKGIVPYQERLKSKIAPLEAAYKRLFDDVCDAFDIGDFNSKERLSGEYLLGFHCQRKWLRDYKLEKGKWVLKTNSELSTEIKQGGE